MEYKIGKEARCAVIGYGSWATAIVGLLAANEADHGAAGLVSDFVFHVRIDCFGLQM